MNELRGATADTMRSADANILLAPRRFVGVMTDLIDTESREARVLYTGCDERFLSFFVDGLRAGGSQGLELAAAQAADYLSESFVIDGTLAREVSWAIAQGLGDWVGIVVPDREPTSEVAEQPVVSQGTGSWGTQAGRTKRTPSVSDLPHVSQAPNPPGRSVTETSQQAYSVSGGQTVAYPQSTPIQMEYQPQPVYQQPAYQPQPSYQQQAYPAQTTASQARRAGARRKGVSRREGILVAALVGVIIAVATILGIYVLAGAGSGSASESGSQTVPSQTAGSATTGTVDEGGQATASQDDQAAAEQQETASEGSEYAQDESDGSSSDTSVSFGTGTALPDDEAQTEKKAEEAAENYPPPVFDSADASSYIPPQSNDGTYVGPLNVIDGDIKTAWNENTKGASGVGQWVRLVSTSGKQAVSGISIVNGYCKTQEWYYKNDSCEKILIELEDGYNKTVTLRDVYGEWQDVEFDTFHLTTYVKVTILSEYQGTGDNKYRDTCISEIKAF